MMIPAFSTVACPKWTLEQVADRAAAYGFPAVELRSFGEASRRFACEPMLTGNQKTLGLFRDAGVSICSVATSATFDHIVDPPVIGNVFGDVEAGVRLTKQAIDLAAAVECPLVRVFPFEIRGGKSRKQAVAMIAERVLRAVDHADRTGVRVMIENGGSFATAALLMDILDRAQTPLLGVCLNVAVAAAAGESPEAGMNVVGDRLMAVRIKDTRDGRPVRLGEGQAPVEQAALTLAATGQRVPLIFEYDAAWFADLPPADQVLPAACKQMFSWIAQAGGRRPVPRPLPATR
jgi:fatty-acyl-CoA synthase